MRDQNSSAFTEFPWEFGDCCKNPSSNLLAVTLLSGGIGCLLRKYQAEKPDSTWLSGREASTVHPTRKPAGISLFQCRGFWHFAFSYIPQAGQSLIWGLWWVSFIQGSRRIYVWARESGTWSGCSDPFSLSSYCLKGAPKFAVTKSGYCVLGEGGWGSHKHRLPYIPSPFQCHWIDTCVISHEITATRFAQRLWSVGCRGGRGGRLYKSNDTSVVWGCVCTSIRGGAHPAACTRVRRRTAATRGQKSALQQQLRICVLFRRNNAHVSNK